jgi:hypothetical protein
MFGDFGGGLFGGFGGDFNAFSAPGLGNSADTFKPYENPAEAPQVVEEPRPVSDAPRDTGDRDSAPVVQSGGDEKTEPVRSTSDVGASAAKSASEIVTKPSVAPTNNQTPMATMAKGGSTMLPAVEVPAPVARAPLPPSGQGGGGSSVPSSMGQGFGSYLTGLSDKYGLPADYLPKTAKIESSWNPNVVSSTGASGLFQFTRGTAKRMGLSDRFDPYASADAAARLAVSNKDFLVKRIGRDPSAGELYLAHQQGASGASHLLGNPSANVVDALTPAYGGNRAAAARAVTVNGGNTRMTAGDFASKWTSKYDGTSSGGTLVAAANRSDGAGPANNAGGRRSDDEIRSMYGPTGINTENAKTVFVDKNGQESDSPTLAWATGGMKNPGLGQQIVQAANSYAAAISQPQRSSSPRMTPAQAPQIVDVNSLAVTGSPLPMNWQA